MADTMRAASAFPWREAMRFAFGRLRWTPREFWAATPMELALAIEGALGRRPAAPLDRTSLETLMKQFPDG